MLYAGTALGSQYLMKSGVFGNTVQTVTEKIPGTSELHLHDGVKESLLKAGATSDQVEQIQAALQEASNPNSTSPYTQGTRWALVKEKTGRSDVRLNNWMHDFMKDTVRELKEDGKSEIKNVLLSSKLASIDVNDPWTTVADKYLSSPKI